MNMNMNVEDGVGYLAFNPRLVEEIKLSTFMDGWHILSAFVHFLGKMFVESRFKRV